MPEHNHIHLEKQGLISLQNGQQECKNSRNYFFRNAFRTPLNSKTMKKTILFIALMYSSIAFSQKVEISVGYGIPSVYGFANEFGNDLVSAITDDGETPGSIGAINAAVMVYNNNMHWRYGLDFVNEFYSTDNTRYSKKSNISIMPRVDHFWTASGKKLRLYSGVSAGIYLDRATIKNKENKEEKIDDNVFGFNVTPIGLRYGNDFSVFIEPNIGTRGTLEVGLSAIL